MAAISSYGPDALTKAYIQLRDERKAIKTDYEAADFLLVQKMDKLEVAMMQKLKEAKVASFKTAYGTVFTVDVTKYTCNDWDAFWSNMIEQGRPDFTEKRVSKGAMDDLIKEGAELPPGISYTTERELRVRRSGNE